MQADLEIFERAVEARGRILRAEADRAGQTVGVLALTFDVGRIVVRPGEDGLLVEHVKEREQLPEVLEGLDEEDPWWRLVGQPILMSRTPSRVAAPPPTAGQHSDEILAELGYDAAAIAGMRDAGVI